MGVIWERIFPPLPSALSPDVHVGIDYDDMTFCPTLVIRLILRIGFRIALQL